MIGFRGGQQSAFILAARPSQQPRRVLPGDAHSGATPLILWFALVVDRNAEHTEPNRNRPLAGTPEQEQHLKRFLKLFFNFFGRFFGFFGFFFFFFFFSCPLVGSKSSCSGRSMCTSRGVFQAHASSITHKNIIIFSNFAMAVPVRFRFGCSGKLSCSGSACSGSVKSCSGRSLVQLRTCGIDFLWIPSRPAAQSLPPPPQSRSSIKDRQARG